MYEGESVGIAAPMEQRRMDTTLTKQGFGENSFPNREVYFENNVSTFFFDYVYRYYTDDNQHMCLQKKEDRCTYCSIFSNRKFFGNSSMHHFRSVFRIFYELNEIPVIYGII
jgi:hypothetical protein